MGLITQLANIVSTSIKAFRGAPGPTINIKAKILGGASAEAEYFQSGGVMHRPAKNSRALLIPIGARGSASVLIGCQNYSISVEVTDGETVIYSTDAAGAIKSKIYLNSLGYIELNGNTKQFVTHAELAAALASFLAQLMLHKHPVAIDPGSGLPITLPTTDPIALDITAAKTLTIKTGG